MTIIKIRTVTSKTYFFELDENYLGVLREQLNANTKWLHFNENTRHDTDEKESVLLFTNQIESIEGV